MSALDLNKVNTLSTQLLSKLDESIFFGRISGFIQDEFNEFNTQVFQAFSDGATELMAENGSVAKTVLAYQKGQGLSGYVVRTKRAYYSNSKRDPLLATSTRDERVECELCVPIISNGAILGTIHIQSENAERDFNENDIERVLEILNHIELPINNMRLYLIAKNLNKELEQKIKEKDEELMQRGPMSSSSSSVNRLSKINMIGHSNIFMDVLRMAEKVALEDFPVFIYGETGTGKKMLAKKIHLMSQRKDRECLVVHCSSLNENQLTTELFGTTERHGVIQRANGGTLILDTVESLPESIQKRLLRLMVSGEMCTTDSDIAININLRVVSVSKNNLKSLADEGKFNEDLMYRLNIMGIRMPSLFERKEDIQLLSESFMNNIQKESKVITSKAIEKLTSYGWPGNIHELKNLMERTSILCSEQFIDETHLPELEVKVEEEEEVVETYSEMTLHALEKMHICRTLDHLGGNKTRAAKCLGITVKTLYNKLHSYGLVNPKEE